MIWRVALWLCFAIQVATFSDDWLEWCLWTPGLLISLWGLSLGARRWFCGSDLFWSTYLLLLVVAPASQLEYDRFLGNISVRGLTYGPALLTTAASLTWIFGGFVAATQALLRRPPPREPEIGSTTPPASAWTIQVLLMIDMVLLLSLLLGLDTWRFVVEGRNYPAKLYNAAPSVSSLVNAIYQLVPMSTCLLALARWQATRRASDMGLLLASGVFLILFANPFNTARFQFAAFLVILGFALFRGRVPLATSMAAIGLFVAVVMPFMNVIRYGLSAVNGEDGLQTTYNRLDFDAFSMSVHCVDRLDDPQFGSPGLYLLSSLLFFVPRPWWPGKAQPSAMDLGQDLMIHAHGWFDNLSNPFYMEFFMDLGWFGPPIAGVLVGWALVHADRVIAEWPVRSFLARALATAWIGFLPILLRGSMGAVIGFFVGTAAVFWGVSVLLRRARQDRAPSTPTADPPPPHPGPPAARSG